MLTRRRDIPEGIMSIKALSLGALAALLFVAVFTGIILTNLRQPTPRPVSAQTRAPIAGVANFQGIDDFRVGGTKVILCGVAYTKGAGALDVATDAARREFQGKRVTCTPVGGGTPCDGRAPATFRGATVAQCVTEDGRDIAAELSARHILCDFPAHSGGHYTACR